MRQAGCLAFRRNDLLLLMCLTLWGASPRAVASELNVAADPPIYHIALTPREARKYGITQLRDYVRASYAQALNKTENSVSEVGYDLLRFWGLGNMFVSLFWGGSASPVGSFMSPQAFAWISRDWIRKAIQGSGAIFLGIALPLLTVQTFSVNPEIEFLLPSLVFRLGGAYSPIGRQHFGRLANCFPAPELLMASLRVPSAEGEVAHSWINRFFKRIFQRESVEGISPLERALRRVRLHADRTCRVWTRNSTLSALEDMSTVKLIRLPFQKEDFDRQSVWLDGRPLTYEQAEPHQFEVGNYYYVFQETFQCL